MPEPVGPVTRRMPWGWSSSLAKGATVVGGHAQAVEAALAAALVEQAQHDAFAVGGGQGGDAHVHLPAGQAQGDAAILRQALFGDVEAGHDLDARGHRGVQGAVGLGDIDEHAVAAKAHDGIAFVGFDVDVAGGLAHGLGEERVDHADDRRVVLGFEEVFDGGQLGHELGEVDFLAHVVDHRGGVAVGAGIGFGQPCLEGGAAEVFDAQRLAEGASDFGEGFEVGAFAQQQFGVVGALPGDEAAVGLGEGVGQGRGAHGLRASVASAAVSGTSRGRLKGTAGGGLPGGGSSGTLGSLRIRRSTFSSSRCWPMM